MPSLLEPTQTAASSPMNIDVVLEAQDEHWVVIARYLRGQSVIRTRTRTFPNYAQARLHSLELEAEARTMATA